MHRELASRSFTDAVLRLANDRVRPKSYSPPEAPNSLIFDLEHTPSSQGENPGAIGGMDRDVFQRSRFGNHGAGIYEAEEPKYSQNMQV